MSSRTRQQAMCLASVEAELRHAPFGHPPVTFRVVSHTPPAARDSALPASLTHRSDCRQGAFAPEPFSITLARRAQRPVALACFGFVVFALSLFLSVSASPVVFQ
ncbi:MAG: hypothetical protein RIS94_3596 [Pseudomonadota bacterium]